MDLIQLAILIIIVGVLLWVANTYIPMDAKIKQVLNVVVVLVLVIYIVSLFAGYLPHIHVGR